MIRPYLIRPPKVYRWLYSDADFRMSEDEKCVYLTFDDGPHPEATPFVLDVLKEHNVSATFFLLGKNVNEHPELVNRIKEDGHTIGNHGMHHLNGWLTPTVDYLSDANSGKKATGSNLFRPAYGKILPMQYRQLKKENRIIFWDVIAGDFDETIGSEQVISNVLENVRAGSVVVFHDSYKAFNHLRSSLSEVIQQLAEKGYTFKAFEAG